MAAILSRSQYVNENIFEIMKSPRIVEKNANIMPGGLAILATAPKCVYIKFQCKDYQGLSLRTRFNFILRMD